jgi:predicted ester cyclase
MWRQAFPDARASIDLLAVQGDLAAVYGTWAGTHQGEFIGVPGTGREFTVPNADFIRFRDGIAVEHWGVFDSGVMMQQLAIVPSMAAVGA